MHNEGNYKRGEKTTFRMAENLGNKATDKELISKMYNGKKTVSSTNGAGKTGQLHVKEWN